MRLTGEIILDDKAISKIKEEVREEVIQDIKESGNYHEEIVSFIDGMSLESFYELLAEVIPSKISKVEPENDLRFSNQKHVYKKLQTIKQIIDL